MTLVTTKWQLNVNMEIALVIYRLYHEIARITVVIYRCTLLVVTESRMCVYKLRRPEMSACSLKQTKRAAVKYPAFYR